MIVQAAWTAQSEATWTADGITGASVNTPPARPPVALDVANPGSYPPDAFGHLLFATKEDSFVATLRCLHLSLVRALFSAAITVALAGSLRAEEATRPESPRPIMRMPQWIESIGEPGAKRMPQANAEAAAPAYRAEVKPAPAVLRAGGAPTDSPAGRQTAEWTELVPTGSPASSPDTAAAVEEPAGKTGLGPEASVLKRWLTDKVGTLPKPSVKLPVPLSATNTTKPDITKPDTTSEVTPQPEASPAELPVAATERPLKTTVTAPVAATPDEMPTLSIDPASFRGVHPGKTTADELRAGWGDGEPFTREDGTHGLYWKIEPFERIEITLDADVVTAIRIKLAEPVAVVDLAKQLEISDLRTVSILDEEGVSIGEVFPERGVIFSVKPGTQSATAVMIEPLDAESFVLRAEGEIDVCSAFAVADLQYAVEIDPRHLRAHRLLMVLMCDQGKWQQALQLAEAAGQIDPSDIWTKMKHARILLSLDRPAEARAVVETVKTVPNSPPLVTAQVERLLGRIELAGPTPDHQRAVEHFAESIRRSSALLTKPSPAVQQAAREIMLDAHLGTAEAIALGTWQQKSRVIPNGWLEPRQSWPSARGTSLSSRRWNSSSAVGHWPLQPAPRTRPSRCPG